ncbi:hypothetical protein IQ268_16785 [Oculatella sp. LEGE 06141]|uniref:hypothetical protein n=1 Tax=Oculatella sp. LEGE 06141 TaxID=1828648 RepID=UPI001880A7AF|nr:hypothetical protein [Oculatella sp. LEGE 06141]MBE9180221.1 hypothetical protein [Oculatella sp. LEGE 06141]
MKYFKTWTGSVLLLSLFALIAPTARANGVRQLARTDDLTIPISPGYGVNVSFIPTGETIQQVWLDDPSWLTLDADGCLSGLGRTNQNCDSNAPATILHLRRIERLNMPGIPRAEQAQLNVVTRSASGDRQIYVFRLNPAETSPNHTIEIVPTIVRELQTVDALAVRRGRSSAIQQGQIESGGALDQRITRFLSLLASQPTPTAAQSAGISLELVARLEQLGQSNASQPHPKATSTYLR